MSAIQRISNGMVSVYTRRLIKGDVYYARFKITNKDVADGQRYVTESLNTTIEAVALDRARDRYAAIRILESENKSLKTGTVKVEIDGFITQYEDGVRKGLKGYSEHMLTGFRKSIVRYFVEYLGSKALRDVSAEDLKGYESWRHDYWAKRIAAGESVHGNVKTKPSQRTIEWEMNAFKQFLRWAAEQGDYSGNALNFKFSADKKHSRSAFTGDQLHKLVLFTRNKAWLDGVGKHGHDARLTRYREMLRTYVVFMAGTGLRPGEARHLRWKDVTSVELTDGQQAIEVFVHASHSKVKKTRTAIGLDIAAMALDHLRGLRKKARDFIAPDDHIWCDTDGTVIKDFREGFNTLIKAAGVDKDSMGNKLAVYSLRHLYITSRIRNGVDLYELAKNTGTSPEMIRTFYDHVPTPDMKDELAKYSKW